MSRYTLKTFYKDKQLEIFEHRNTAKLKSILAHPKMHQAGAEDAWGTPLKTAERFEILDSQREKLFTGNVADCIEFIKKLK